MHSVYRLPGRGPARQLPSRVWAVLATIAARGTVSALAPPEPGVTSGAPNPAAPMSDEPIPPGPATGVAVYHAVASAATQPANSPARVASHASAN